MKRAFLGLSINTYEQNHANSFQLLKINFIRMKNIWFFIILFFEIIGNLQVFAVPAYPYPIKVTQPDGSDITFIMKGDEFYHYHTTLDGYPI
ncbi:MAG TPA: hypothetical protein PLR72_03240, partial [Paludibacteraceae bacterium]|nr:hypothetical protein [Paludibacteraceae bacterium]